MEKKIYDNSNIAESYAGVTTPLTFSFARYVYQEVYQHFSRMMGASEKVVKENAYIFEHMIEFIGYRIYYNLNSWYVMLSFFPGYRFSGEFMEKMMGVEKRGSFDQAQYNFYQKYLLYLPKTIWQTVTISLAFMFLGWRMKGFNKYFEQIFSKLNKVEVDTLNLNELRSLYKEVDKKLLSRWRVPIANDFAVMVSAGLADKLFKKWLASDDAYLYMRTDTNKPLISLDPSNRLTKIVSLINGDETMNQLFSNKYAEEVMEILHTHFATHPATREIDSYVNEFGVRMPNELKLESETLVENPHNVIALIKGIMKSDSVRVKFPEPYLKEFDYKNLGLTKKVFLRWLLRWAGNSIHRREEARFCRTLIFGYIRKIFLAIGEKLHQKGVIKNPRDVFYLSIDEIFNMIDSQEVGFNPLIVIEERKQSFAQWQDIELPRRIETSKSIAEVERELLTQSTADQKQSLDALGGRVVSSPRGQEIFSGVALTLKEFDPAADFEGKILITRQTDPGWTIIFPLLKGVVVERGGMLSHAAIVARELNIPCIVGVHQATDFVSNGEEITLDLKNGLILKK